MPRQLHMMRRWLASSLGLFFVGVLLCAQSPYAAFPPGAFQSRAAIDAGAGGSVNSWDGSYNPAITLTNSNFTAKNGVGGSQSSIRTAGSFNSTAKAYWEILVDSAITDWAVGFANASYTNSQSVIGTTNSVGTRVTDTVLFQFFSSIGTITPIVAGTTQRVGFAVDATTNKVWFRTLVGGAWGLWNADVIGNQNPGVAGGYVFTGSGPWFIVWTSIQFNNQATGAFACADWFAGCGGAPSGFTQVFGP